MQSYFWYWKHQKWKLRLTYVRVASINLTFMTMFNEHTSLKMISGGMDYVGMQKKRIFSNALFTFACPVWFDSTLAWWKVLRVGRPHVSYLHAAPKLAQVPIGRSGSPRLPGSLFIWDLENIGILNCYIALVLLPFLTWTSLNKCWAFLFNFSPPW